MSNDALPTVRGEQPQDLAGVRRVVIAAFGQNAEADLVDALRSSGDAVLSLVAERDGTIVGHVLFSKLRAPAGCLALAPVAVEPDLQQQGIGSALVKAGLVRSAQEGWPCVFVLGDPAYYTRFGFDVASAARFETAYPRGYFMALELAPNALACLGGAVVFAQPFLDLE